MSEPTSLKSVIALCHVELEQLFCVHQEALLTGQLSGALDALHRYSVAHDLHMRFEDEHLFPRLAELADPGHWPLSIYQHEHEKITDRLQQIRTALTDLIEKNVAGTELRIAIIALLDREKSFKGLCEHHQEREEAGLLPALDEQTDARWRQKLIGPFEQEWQALLGSFT